MAKNLLVFVPRLSDPLRGETALPRAAPLAKEENYLRLNDHLPQVGIV